MRTLYIERSVADGSRGDWVEHIGDISSTISDGISNEDREYDRIVVGTGPGSFAGIRSALAFAQGFAIGSGCEVLGLPSPCSMVNGEGPMVVVCDARRDMFWVALFDGFKMIGDVFQVNKEDLAKRVPRGVKVTTPDAARIDALLKETFGENYVGGGVPTAEGLMRFAKANPGMLKPEPLPIYLNPAVRP